LKLSVFPMESVIELQRSGHEETERVELAIVEEYKNLPKTVSSFDFRPVAQNLLNEGDSRCFT